MPIRRKKQIDGDLYVPGSIQVLGGINASTYRKTVTRISVTESDVVAVEGRVDTAEEDIATIEGDISQLISDISNDNLVTPVEKKELKRTWESLKLEYPLVLAQADLRSITAGNAARLAYTGAYAALDSALETGASPILADMTESSVIVGATFRALWSAYYEKKQALMEVVETETIGKTEYFNGFTVNGGTLTPTAPTITVKGVFNRAFIYWDKQANLTGNITHKVYRSDASGSGYVAIATVEGYTYEDAGLALNGTSDVPLPRTYYYKVARLVNGTTESSASTFASITVDSLPASAVAASAISAAKIAAGAISISKFASTIRPPRVVASVPVVFTDYANGDMIYVTGESCLYKFNGTAFIKAIGASDIVANAITAGQIAAGAIAADELAANAVTATKILAGSVLADKLSVLATNEINNPTLSGNINGWGNVLEDGSGTPLNATYDATEKAIKVTTSSQSTVRSIGFKVDHNKIYRVSIMMKKSAVHGVEYIGLYGGTAAIIGYDSGATSGSGPELITPVTPATRAEGTPVANFYNLSGYAGHTEYKKFVFFIVGSKRSSLEFPDIADEAGVTTVKATSAKLAATTTHLAIRILNWTNTISTSLYIKNITVEDIAGGLIVAENIVAGTITATQIGVGAITADRIVGTTLSGIRADLGTITTGRIFTEGELDIEDPQKSYIDMTNGSMRMGTPTKGIEYDGINLNIRDTDMRLTQSELVTINFDGDTLSHELAAMQWRDADGNDIGRIGLVNDAPNPLVERVLAAVGTDTSVAAGASIPSVNRINSLLYNGKIYMPRNGGTAIDIYDIATNTVSTSVAIGNYGRGTSQLYNGKIYLPQSNGTNFEIYDIATNTVSSGVTLGNYIRLTSQLYNGKIYLPQSNGTNFEIYDIATNTVSSGVTLGNYTRSTSQLYNGKIYMPRNSGTAIDIYDIATNTVSASVLITSASRSTSQLYNGKIYMPRNGGTAIDIYDIATNTVSTSVAIGNYNRLTSAIYRDKLYLPQYGGTNFEIYDIATNTVSSGVTLGSYNRATLQLYNGKIYLPQYGGTNLEIVTVGENCALGAGIIERGSNTNGKYIKFSDGTLIQYGTASASFAAAATAAATCNFPASFIDTSYHQDFSNVLGTPSGQISYYYNVSGRTTTQMVVSYATYNLVATTMTSVVYWSAIGRWRA